MRAMRIDVAESEGAEDLVIRDGLVRIARIDRPAFDSAAAAIGLPSLRSERSKP